jgi:WD40 repeat protein
MYAVLLPLLSLFPFVARADDDFREFKGHEGPVRVVRFTPDGTKLVSGSGYPYGDGTIRVWDVKTGKELLKIKAHQGNVDNLVLSKDGKLALSASGDKTAKLWNLETGKLVKSFEGHEKYVTGLALSPDGTTVATGSGDTHIRFFSIETGKEVKKLEGHTGDVRCLAFADEGKTLLSSATDGTVRLWDQATGKEKSSIRTTDGRIESFVLTPGGKEIVIGGQLLSRWELATGKEVKSYTGPAQCLAVSDDGKRLLTGRADGTMHVWNLATGEEKARYQAHAGRTYAVAFAPGGKLAASGGGSGPPVDGKPVKGEDFVVRVWKLDE